MFAVIFEVQPKSERWDDYLGIAKTLKPSLEKIDGFIDNERFSSRRRKGRLLSLSIWRDEKAVIRWRTLALHHQAQEKGRFELFEDYHLRVGEITADTGAAQGEKLAQQRFDETEVGVARAMTISEWTPAADRPGADLPPHPDSSMPGSKVSSIMNSSRASPARASCSFSPPGGRRRWRRLGPRRLRPATSSATGRSALFATTECSIAARRRNSIRALAPVPGASRTNLLEAAPVFGHSLSRQGGNRGP